MIPDITSPLPTLATLFIAGGVFLLLIGINILKVEKVSITPGKKTVVTGSLLTLIGISFLLGDIFLHQQQIFSPVNTLSPTASVTPTPAPPTFTFTPFNPQELPTSTPAIVLPTSTVTPSFTPPPTNTPSPTFTIPAYSPELAIRDYYSLINSRNYAQAWTWLSERFRKDIDYEDQYVGFWNTIESVSIDQTALLEISPIRAKILVEMTYYKKNGQVVKDRNFQVEFIWDPIRLLWLIDHTET
ncbi:MAG: hypothetical protein AB1509_09285 [Chloroflexota bacterium]